MSTVQRWLSKFKLLFTGAPDHPHVPDIIAPTPLHRPEFKKHWDSQMNQPRPTICTAAKQGNIEEIKKFLENGTDVNITNPHGETPLHLAVAMNRGECVKFLLTVPDIRVDAETHHGYTPLHLACKMHTGGLKMLKRLIAAKADVNICLLENFSPLHSLCESLNIIPFHDFDRQYKLKLRQAELLIQNGADVNIREEINGETAIFVAIERDALEMVEILLYAGALADVQRYDDYVSPLTLAAQMNRRLILDILIPFVVDINMGTSDNRTALMLTSTSKITNRLLVAGADPNIKAFDYNVTAAHLATARHNIRQLELLYPLTNKDLYSRDFFEDLFNSCGHGNGCPIEILHYLLTYDLNRGTLYYNNFSTRMVLGDTFKKAVIYSNDVTIWDKCYECILMLLPSVNLAENSRIFKGRDIFRCFYTDKSFEFNGRIEILLKLCADHGMDINDANKTKESCRSPRVPVSNPLFELHLRRYLISWNQETFYNKYLKDPGISENWQIIEGVFDEGTLKSHCRRVIRKQLKEKYFFTTQKFLSKIQQLPISTDMKDYIRYKFDSRLLTT